MTSRTATNRTQPMSPEMRRYIQIDQGGSTVHHGQPTSKPSSVGDTHDIQKLVRGATGSETGALMHDKTSAPAMRPRPDRHSRRPTGMTASLPDRLLVARFDGVGFSRLTAASFAKPFDRAFADAMTAAGHAVLEHLNADLVYVGSDEITAFVHPDLAPYAGRSEKLTSVGAAYATSAFMLAAGLAEPIAFDGRLTEMTPDEAGGDLLDRRSSVKRNAVSDALYWHWVQAGQTARAVTKRLNAVPLTERFAQIHELGIVLEDRQAFGVILRRDGTVEDAVWELSVAAAGDLRTWRFRVPAGR